MLELLNRLARFQWLLLHSSLFRWRSSKCRAHYQIYKDLKFG